MGGVFLVRPSTPNFPAAPALGLPEPFWQHPGPRAPPPEPIYEKGQASAATNRASQDTCDEVLVLDESFATKEPIGRCLG